MATIEQVQRGIANFIDVEFAPKLDDAKQRLLVGGLGGLFAANAGRVLAANKDKIGLALLGVMVPSRFMRKFICRLRLNEVSRQ